mmetsp:Transcript_53370/g.129826  ORF Transcript_53370/g.129826 Transcript_53370/m.129826 type:complete len:668 (-) Transcript_53370:320-2323(-)
MANSTPIIEEEEIVEEEIIEDSSSSGSIIEEELIDTDDDDILPPPGAEDPEGAQGMVQSFHAGEIANQRSASQSSPSTPESKNNNNNNRSNDVASVDTNSTDDWGQKWGQSWNKESRASQQQKSGGGGDEIQDLETFAAAGGTSSTATKAKVRKVMSPSSYMLFCLGVLIVLITGGIVTGVAIYLRDDDALDPLDRPTISPSPNAPNTPPTVPDFPTAAPSAAPSVQFTVLLDLFASVAGDDVYQTGTSANLAANWMIVQDPQLVDNGGTVPQAFTDQRTEAGWTQRYLLVLLYYSTTNNRDTTWLSCNPLEDATSTTSTACQFTNPSEITGNRIIYDIVPSNRWLSAADECDWAGITCITVGDTQAGVTRRAVTTINLAGQRLGGSIVTELVELPDLNTLDLSYNGLAGTLDNKFKTLQTLNFQFNALTGPIPDTFFNETSVMERLNVGANQMTGTIPGEVGLASKMTGLYVFENEFSGSIPVLGNMPLRQFQGQGNRFTGILPFDLFIGSWAETINEWWVFDNELSGRLSQNLGLFPNLQDFRASNNSFVGEIPTSIYSLEQLFRLELNDNLLSGRISDTIGDMTKLETLDLSGNSFTGIVPTEISDLDFLQSVKVQFNSFQGTIPTGLCFLPSMEELVADCIPNPCACCTVCCNRDLETCEGDR